MANGIERVNLEFSIRNEFDALLDLIQRTSEQRFSSWQKYIIIT